MKEVTINISSVGFPSQFVSDAEKETYEFGLQIGQAIQYEWFRKDSTGCRYYSNWRDFNRLRLYARGEQSIAKYKNELAVDGDLSYLNLDWTPIPIIPKFVDIVVNGMSDRLFDVKCYAQDSLSAEKRNQFQEMVERNMVSQDLFRQTAVINSTRETAFREKSSGRTSLTTTLSSLVALATNRISRTMGKDSEYPPWVSTCFPSRFTLDGARTTKVCANEPYAS